MNITWVILATFATYRVSLMVTQEDGPFWVFLALRNQFIEDGDWLAKGIRCVWCVSFWFSGVTAVLLWIAGSIAPTEIVLVWLGMAGIVVMIDKSGRR